MTARVLRFPCDIEALRQRGCQKLALELIGSRLKDILDQDRAPTEDEARSMYVTALSGLGITS